MPITLVAADGHPLMLFALGELFAREADFSLLAKCANGEEALSAVRRHRPDVLVLDPDTPGKGGMEVLRELRGEKDATRVVLLAARFDEDAMLEAIHLGVRGVVLKEMEPQLLIQCIRKVHAGEEWLERGSIRRVLEMMFQRGAEAEASSNSGHLSPREAELARLVADGLSNKEIARRIESSEGAVKVCLHRIYAKLGLRGRMNLARWLQERGL